jgi:hypothetical protein
MVGGRPQGLPAHQGRVAGVFKKKMQRRRIDVTAANPNGIVASSPRLLSLRGYLGSRCGNGFNRNAVVANVARDGWVKMAATALRLRIFRTLTQGSSSPVRLGPTLGFGTESRWDSVTATIFRGAGDGRDSSASRPRRWCLFKQKFQRRRFDVAVAKTMFLASAS